MRTREPDDFAVRGEQLDGGHAVATVLGSVDIFTAPELKTRLNEILGAHGESLVLDLTHAGYVDSSGLGVLLATAKRLRARGGALVVVNSNANIARLFEITGVDTLFTVVPSRELALEQLQQTSTH